MLLATEYLLVTVAGIWLQLAGLALFCLTGIAHSAIHPAAFRAVTLDWPATRSGDTRGNHCGRSGRGTGPGLFGASATADDRAHQAAALRAGHGAWQEAGLREGRTRLPAPCCTRSGLPRRRRKAGEAVRCPRGCPVRSKVRPGAQSQLGMPTPHQPPRPPGRTLGRYELERVIGRGAMATVYLGTGPDDQPPCRDQDAAARRGVCGQRPRHGPVALHAGGRIGRATQSPVHHLDSMTPARTTISPTWPWSTSKASL